MTVFKRAPNKIIVAKRVLGWVNPKQMSDQSEESTRFVTCRCQHCEGGIEFDANQLGESENCPVACPHCGVETIISRPKLSFSPSANLQAAQKQNARLQGSIGYFGLRAWWLTEFTDEEREHIELKYTPLGAGSRPLTEGEISFTTETVVSLLSGLAGWFSSADEFTIGKRIIKKLIEIIDSTDPHVLELHFAYTQIIENFYRARHVDASALERAIWGCEKQIAIAAEAAEALQKSGFSERELPSHKGYEQLAIVLEKQKNYDAVIGLCNQAKMQGWAGTWDRRIERCQQKLCKS